MGRASKEAAGRVAVLVVKGPAAGRWRAGRRFGAEPTVVVREDLDDDQVAAILADPALSVLETERDDDPEDGGGTGPATTPAS